ncbi:hypothetical protein [Lapidilactobacillus dextrinicus]|uniref:hypothetical protein n=1 Tax=Lapidilactobacillus dextrinicus TaxID=51664 RepID=UPI0022DFA995|nr:hypothetical protein [Lapidilactobacillus dextrinicus]
MQLEEKVSKSLYRTILCTAGFLIWWTSFFIIRTDFNNILPAYIMSDMRYLGIIVAVISLFLLDKFYLRRLIIGVAILVCILLNNDLLGNEGLYLDFSILLICAVGIDIEKFLKICFYWLLGCMVFVFICIKVKILPDEIIYSGQRYRHYLGYNWVSFAAQYYLYLIALAITVLKKRASILLIIGLELINIYIYFKTKTSSPFALTTLALFGWLLMNLGAKFMEKKLTRNLLYVIIPFGGVLVTYLSRNYLRFTELNTFLSGRLVLGYNALIKYSIGLIGKPISLSSEMNVIGQEYTFVDSSVLSYLINFGIISFLVLSIAHILLIKRAYLERKYYFLLALALVMLNGLFDPQLTEPHFNLFLITLATLFQPINKEVKS